MKPGAREDKKTDLKNKSEEQQYSEKQEADTPDNGKGSNTLDDDKSDDSNKSASISSKKETITLDREEYDKLITDLEKQKQDYLYLYAEMENLNKRVIKERSELFKYGSQNVFTALLEIVDNFERALSLEVNKDNIEAFTDGVKLINNLLLELLSNFSVKEVPSLRKPFDPMVHEALGTEPSSDIEEGCISKVLVKPYKLHDKVIRTGHVIVVNNGKSNEMDSNTEDKNDNDLEEK